jgi:hypothetical protein
MVEPTYRTIELFDKYGAKLTIMADVAEILKFKEYYEKHNNDKFFYEEIVQQLQYAIKNGHDVQLHIHSSYYGAEFQDGKWNSNWAEYNLAKLKIERQNEIIAEGKKFLEDILKQVDSNYNCFVFRAANWSMIPSVNISKALIKNGIKIDSSVFKYGSRSGMVNFDYSSAFSETVPWPVKENDVRERDENGRLIEFPIYCENRSLKDFISLNRFYRVMQSRLHNFKESKPFLELQKESKEKQNESFKNFFSKLFDKHALKADFNQCTGRQLIKQINRVKNKYSGLTIDIPFVTIGHSKLFNIINEISLTPFLKYVNKNSNDYFFAVFNDFNLEDYREK